MRRPTALLLLPFLLLSPSLSLAQTTSTAALTSLTSGPLSYASASLSTNPSCRTLCQTLITSARTCTEDECACGDGVVNGAESCLDCLIGDVGANNGQTIRTGFNGQLALTRGLQAEGEERVEQGKRGKGGPETDATLLTPYPPSRSPCQLTPTSASQKATSTKSPA
jgi:hypothetical protein